MTGGRSEAPPAGAPWDTPIADASIAFVDLEFTGLDAAHDRIVEVCVQRCRNGVLETEFASLVNPQAHFKGPSMAIHGIAPAELERAPVFAGVWPQILAALQGAIVVAHGAQTDMAFLRAELARLPAVTPAAAPPELAFYLDTLTLSRRCFLFESHALSALCTNFGIARDHAHRAEDDVRALRVVFSKILEVLRPATARDLWQVRVKQALPREDILAQALAAVEAALEVRLTYRPSGKKPVIMRVVVVSVAADQVSIHCRDVSNFSRYDLRASRVLAIESLAQ